MAYTPHVQTAKEFLEEKIDGLMLARECEQAVVDHLKKYETFFDQAVKEKEPIQRSLLRACRQLYESKKIVRDLSIEINHLRSLL